MGLCFLSPQAHTNTSSIVREHDSGSTAELRSLSDARDPRLDALTGSRNGQTIKVRAQTFDLMKQAHDVLQEVGYHTFPDGPGNQEEALWMGQGRSAGRMLMSRAEDVDDQVVQPRVGSQDKNTGGGNCLEYSRVTLMELFSRGSTVPLFDVKEANMGHRYVIMGDWRDRTMGDQAIVVDA